MFARFPNGCWAFSPEKLKYINLDSDSVNELKVGNRMQSMFCTEIAALKSFEARLPSNVSTRMEMANCRWKSLGDKMQLSKSCIFNPSVAGSCSEISSIFGHVTSASKSFTLAGREKNMEKREKTHV